MVKSLEREQREKAFWDSTRNHCFSAEGFQSTHREKKCFQQSQLCYAWQCFVQCFVSWNTNSVWGTWKISLFVYGRQVTVWFLSVIKTRYLVNFFLKSVFYVSCHSLYKNTKWNNKDVKDNSVSKQHSVILKTGYDSEFRSKSSLSMENTYQTDQILSALNFAYFTFFRNLTFLLPFSQFFSW